MPNACPRLPLPRQVLQRRLADEEIDMAIHTAAVVAATLLLLAVWQLPILFSTLTLLVSLFLLGRLERDRNLHDLAFYATGPLPDGFRKWLHRYGYSESAVRSLILGFLALIQSSGTDGSRVFLVGVAFCFSVVVGFLLLRWLQQRIRLNVRRWGYVRLSVLLGAAFSFLLSGTRPEFSWKNSRDVILEIFTQPDFDRMAELINLLTSVLNASISYLLERLFANVGVIGELVAFVIAAVLTTDLVFGFVIVAYSMLLLELSEKLKRTVDRPGMEADSGG